MAAIKRRTKMSRTPHSVLRAELALARTPEEFVKRAKRYKSKRVREAAEIAQTTKPKKIRGFTVYFADFRALPLLKGATFIAGKLVFLDRKTYGRVPHKLLRFILEHEYREELLMIARYSTKQRKGGSSVHRIALRKELRDVQRAGLLGEYLLMLKKRVPPAYAERIRKWDIDTKTLEPKAKRQAK